MDGGRTTLQNQYGHLFRERRAVCERVAESRAYPLFSICIALAIVVLLFSSAWFTRDRIPTLSQPLDDAAPFTAGEFFRDILKAFGNRNYLYLLLALFSLSAMLGLRTGMLTYMNVYYWELSAEQFGSLLLIGSFFGYLTGFLFSANIHDRFDKAQRL